MKEVIIKDNNILSVAYTPETIGECNKLHRIFHTHSEYDTDITELISKLKDKTSGCYIIDSTIAWTDEDDNKVEFIFTVHHTESALIDNENMLIKSFRNYIGYEKIRSN